MLEFRDIWEKDYCVCSCEGISVKVLWEHFTLHNFPPNLGGWKLWVRERKFSPGFSILSVFLLLPNGVFHPIFFPLFSIFPIFTPTKHSVKVHQIFGPQICGPKTSITVSCYIQHKIRLDVKYYFPKSAWLIHLNLVNWNQLDSSAYFLFRSI